MSEKVRLVMTCGACPEQYDAFIGNELVGYLRLRHGTFYVECPTTGGEEVYRAAPRGDGIFEPEERDFYLRHAVKAILDWRAGCQEAPNVDYEIEGDC